MRAASLVSGVSVVWAKAVQHGKDRSYGTAKAEKHRTGRSRGRATEVWHRQSRAEFSSYHLAAPALSTGPVLVALSEFGRLGILLRVDWATRYTQTRPSHAVFRAHQPP